MILLSIFLLIGTVLAQQGHREKVECSVLAGYLEQLTQSLGQLSSRLDLLEEERRTRLKPLEQEWKLKDKKISELATSFKDLKALNPVPFAQKIAFHVVMSSPMQYPGNMEFQLVMYSEGDGWDRFANQFIAPTPGLYVFNLVMYNAQTSSARVSFMQNGNALTPVIASNILYGTGSVSVVRNLVTRDHVYSRLTTGRLYRTYPHFSGFLLAE